MLFVKLEQQDKSCKDFTIMPNNQHRKVASHEYGIGGPLTFLILFVLFVYGSLLVGMLGASRWIIKSQNLVFFAQLGGSGIVLMMCCLFFIWFSVVALAAGVPYLWLRYLGRYRLADKVALIITLFLFHIFSVPFILWRMIRQNSPQLRRRHAQKLRRMVQSSKKMQERRLERFLRSGNRFSDKKLRSKTKD